MLGFIKKNKLFALLLFLTFCAFVIGILLPSVLDNDTKGEISSKIINMFSNVKGNRVGEFNNFRDVLFNNSINIILIWLFGISIAFIPLIIILYLSRVVLFGLNISFLIINIKSCNLLFIIIYLIPLLFNILILFFLSYYAINYSLILIKLLFFKKNYNLKAINKRYIRVFILTLLCSLISSIFETILLPKIFLYLF